MKSLIRSFIFIAALQLFWGCGSAPEADLSSFLTEDGLYTFSVKDVTFTLTPVGGGTFSMGETFDQGVRKNPDIHQVILDGFAIGTTEVSQALWKAVMGNNPSPKEIPTAPVNNISWKDASKFVGKLSSMTGIAFRLPTEAEWEFAARGGNSLSTESNNGLGLKAMVGSVWEWCSDVYEDDLGDNLKINPTGPEKGDKRALRGGSSADPKKDCMVSSRKGLFGSSKSSTAGLRVAVSTGEKCPEDIFNTIVYNKVPREEVSSKVEKFSVGGVSFRMMPVEGGTFLMGATPEQLQLGKDDEKPVHEVSLDDFMIGEFEVTCDLWQAVMGYLPPYLGGGSYPVGNVSWYDAWAFIRKLNYLTGRKFRLPTEAEWEYAARGGKKAGKNPFIFAGSMHSSPVAYCEAKDLKPQPVGKLQPNQLGTYDMSGNVWEWVQDRYGPYSSEAQVNPQGPLETESGLDYRVLRGGSAAAKWDKCRTSNRSENKASFFKSTMGFRLAL